MDAQKQMEAAMKLFSLCEKYGIRKERIPAFLKELSALGAFLKS